MSRNHRRGQSMTEYMIVTVAIIVAIIALRVPVFWAWSKLMQSGVNKVNQVAR